MRSAVLPFPEYRPDVAAINGGFCDLADGVIPAAMSYRPLASPTVYSDALTARCQGATAVTDNGGNAVNFAGDETKLYNLSSGSWVDVSGSAYTTPADATWRFAKFGDLVVATNGIDAPQKCDISGAIAFSNLGGSPPAAKYIAVVRDFLVLGNVGATPDTIRWSAFNNAEGWTIGTDQSDFQQFPDGGWVQGIVGGEVLYVFQEKSIRRGGYVGGNLIFQFDEIVQNRGLVAPGSLAKVGADIYFLDYDGFYVLGADVVRPLGKERIDKTFFTDVNQAFLYRIQAAIDPINSLVIWAYPSINSVDGTLDKVLIYNWAIDRFSTAAIESEYIFSTLQEGYTLEQMDVFGTLETIPFSLDSRIWTGGAISMGVFDADHKLSFLTGPSLEATIKTSEISPEAGRRVAVARTLPVVDTADVTVAIGSRERYADAIVFSSESSMTTSGYCPIRASGRSLCGRLTIPAGSTWSHAEGVEVFYRTGGR